MALFYCFLNSEVRQTLRHRFIRWRESRNIHRSSSLKKSRFGYNVKYFGKWIFCVLSSMCCCTMRNGYIGLHCIFAYSLCCGLLLLSLNQINFHFRHSASKDYSQRSRTESLRCVYATPLFSCSIIQFVAF